MNNGVQATQSGTFVVLVGLALAYVLLLSLYRRREGVRHFLRGYIVALIAYVGVALYLVKSGLQPLPAIAIGVLAGFAMARLLVPRRSRYIPRSERRRAIAAYERDTRRKYDPKTDEFDHEIAFARGGSSTADNLRIRSRTENRRKGKKSPWWDLLGR
jgi:hypothetical protein